MDNKLVGLLVMLVVLVGLVFKVAQGDISGFISLESLIFIIGVGGGMTYMRKHKINEDQLGTAIKDNFIIAGWLGTVVGLISMLPGIGFEEAQFRVGLAAAMLPILYGYILGSIAQAYLDK